MFEFKLLLLSILLSISIDSALERIAIVGFSSGSEVSSVNYITDTHLYGERCTSASFNGMTYNIIRVDGADLCECPSPSSSGNYDIHGRLGVGGVVEYLCVDGWYSKIVRVVDA